MRLLERAPANDKINATRSFYFVDLMQFIFATSNHNKSSSISRLNHARVTYPHHMIARACRSHRHRRVPNKEWFKVLIMPFQSKSIPFSSLSPIRLVQAPFKLPIDSSSRVPYCAIMSHNSFGPDRLRRHNRPSIRFTVLRAMVDIQSCVATAVQSTS